MAAMQQWEIHGMDVITAYLLGILDEAIYGTASNKRSRSMLFLSNSALSGQLPTHAFTLRPNETFTS